MISIVMAVKNEERYVQQAIQSIKDQTETDWELIIMESGSTDSTLEKIAAVCGNDDRIYLDSSEDDLPWAIKMQQGLSQVHGEYVIFHPGDDISDPLRFELQLKAINKDKEILAVGSSVMLIDQDGHLKELKNLLTKSYQIRNALAVGNQLYFGSAMFRKESCRYFDHRWTHCHDYDLFCKLALKGKVINLPDHLYSYREHEGNLTHRKYSEQRAEADIIRALYYRTIRKIFSRRLWIANRNYAHQMLMFAKAALVSCDYKLAEKAMYVVAANAHPDSREYKVCQWYYAMPWLTFKAMRYSALRQEFYQPYRNTTHAFDRYYTDF